MERVVLNKRETKSTSFFILIMILISAIGANAPIVEVEGIGNLYLFRLMIPILLLLFFKAKFHNNRVLHNTIVLFVVWLLCATVSLLWSFNFSNSVSALFNYIICFIWVVWLVGVVKTKRMFQNMILFMTGIILVCCVLGIYEAYTGIYMFNVQEGLDVHLTSAGLHYPVVFFFNPNDFMFFVIGIIPFLFYVVRERIRRKSLRKIMYIAYTGLSCYMLWLADCRMGFIVLPFMLFVFLLSKNFKKRFPIALVVLISVAVIILLRYPQLIQSFLRESRWDIWHDAINNFYQSKFLGTGLGNANYHLANVTYASDITATHFWFLQIFVELGIFFIPAFLVWYYKIFKSGVRMIKSSNKNYRRRGRVVIVFIVALIPMSTMSSSFAILPVFWTYIAFLLLAISVKDKKAEVKA